MASRIENAEWTKTHPIHRDENTIKLEVDHGIRDEKGRVLGGYAIVYFWGGNECNPAGFRLNSQPTRNGVRFGASHKDLIFPTIEEAKAMGVKALEKQAKAYAKKYPTQS